MMTTNSKRKEKLGSNTGKVFSKPLRWLLFHAAWIFGVAVVVLSQIAVFAPVFDFDFDGPSFYILFTGVWIATVYAAYFAIEIVVPVMVTVLLPKERLKDPRQVIKMGQRFRGFGLRAPIVYLVEDGYFFFEFQRIWGFFSLPKPFGAILLIKKSAHEKLTFEEFDAFVAQQVVRANFYTHLSEKFQLAFCVPAMVLFYVFLGNTLGQLLPDAYRVYNDWLTLVGAAAFAFLGFIFIRSFHQRQVIGLDFRTTRSFKLSINDYFFMLEKIFHQNENLELLRIPRGLRAISLEERRIENEFENYHLIDTGVYLLPWKRFWRKWRKPLRHTALAVVTWALICAVYPAIFVHPWRRWTAEIESNNENRVRAYLEFKSFAGRRDPFDHGATALLKAARTGNLQVIYLLLQNGSSMDETDDLGRNVMYYALLAPNRYQVVSYLLQGRVDLFERDVWGLTALDYSRIFRFSDTERLISRRMDQLPRMPSSTNKSSKIEKATKDKKEKSKKSKSFFDF